MTQPSWKRRPLPWAGSGETTGTVVVPPPPTSPPPGGPPPSGPPAPPAAGVPVITAGQQTNRVRSDIAIGTTTSALVATNNPTAWYLIIGEPTYWKFRSDGRFESLRALDPTRTEYVFFVVATNSAGASATTMVVIPVEIIATPTPSAPPPTGGGGGTTNGIPNELLNLATAPTPVYPGDSTSGISTQETYPAGEWPSVVRRGPVIGENNTWDIGPGKWNKAFVANPDAAINSGQFHQSVWVGAATSDDTVSFRLRYKWPTGQSKPSGADSEVTSYPSVGRGALLGWSHRQLRRPANVPKRFKDHTSLWVSSTSISASVSCKGHLSDDMRATNSDAPTDTYDGAVAQITAEFMIVHRTYEGYGMGPGARPSGSHRGTLTIGGIEWYIHTQGGATFFPDGSRAMLLAFIPTSGILPIHVNYAPVLEFCCTRRYRDMPNGPGSYFERGRGPDDFLISPDSFLAQGFFGYEPDGTDGGEVDIQVGTHVWAVNLYTGGGVSQPVPVITPGQVFSVKEDAAVGTVIGTLAASNSPTGYSIVSGGSGKFSIGSDGRITVASALDYETMQSATLTFRATNAAGASANVTGVVNIGNVAEVAPSITSGQSFTVAENVTPGTVFATVAATPGDAPIFGFQIVSGNTGNTIGINAAGGLFVAAPMTDGSLTLGIKAYSGSLESSVTSVGLTITAVAAPPAAPAPWPSLLTVAPTDSPVYTAMTLPAMGSAATDPRTSSLSAPSKVTRVSPGASDTAWPGMGAAIDAAQYGSNNCGPVYSKVPVFNSIGSQFIVWDIARGSQFHLCDASTKARIRDLPITPNHRWFKGDADKIAFMNWATFPDIEPILRVHNVAANTSAVLKDFGPLGYVKATSLFGGEGNQDDADRYWPLGLQNSDGNWFIVVWDRVADAVVSTIPLASRPDSGGSVDWWGMSPSGNFIVTLTYSPWVSGGTPVPLGANVWSRSSGQLLRTKYNGQTYTGVMNHCDIGKDSQGFDVMVYVGPQNDVVANDKFILTWRLDGSSGMNTQTQGANGLVVADWHISAQSPGWAVLGSFPNPVTTVGQTAPLHNHIFALKLDGSGNVYLIGQARHSNELVPAPAYYYMSAFACANRAMTMVAARSNWSFTGTTATDAYMGIWEAA